MFAAIGAGEPVKWGVNVAKIVRTLADELSSTSLKMLVMFWDCQL
jgi:hypothetical protein